ncbi:MAG: FxsA family protein [Actinobacteria bacterium]|nr:FxsA family protein [Actinomycetota bacterium]
MAVLLFILLIAVPIAELYVIVQVAQGIGVINTLVILVAISILGAWLLKQQGMATWRRLQATLARGEMPTKEVTDGAMILLGGALLMTPGFLSDIIGIVLLFPPTRAALKGGTRKLFRRWAENKVGPGVRIYRTNVPTEPRPAPPGSPRLPSEDPSDEDGSPDRG